jgi:hypothetical protein
VDFDELEVDPAIEEKIWIKHRVTVDEVEEALLNSHIERRKPETTDGGTSTGGRMQGVIFFSSWNNSAPGISFS